MNKFVKVLLIIAACLAGLGVLVTAFGVYWSVRVADRLLPDEAVSQTLAVDVTALRDIRIDTGVSELRFETVPASEARVETSGFSEGEMELMQQDGVLTVRSRSALGDGDIINLGVFRIDWLGRIHTGTLQPRTVTVYLPQAALDSFELNAGVGDVSGALPFTVQRMDISCGTGSVTLSGLRAQQLSLSCGAGNVVLSNLQAQQLSLSRGVGSVTLTDFSCETLDLTGGTGSAELKNGGATVRASLSVGVGDVTVSGGQWNALSVTGGTGSFTFDGSLRGVCAVEGGVGDADLRFADGASNYEVELHKGVGDIDVKGADLVVVRENETYAVNPGAGTGNFLTVEQGMGSIRLRFPE